MVQRITNLGELGTTAGILRDQAFTLQRDGADWNLNGYTGETIKVWPLRTRAAVATPGTVVITDAPNGLVTWTPGADAYAASGVYEGRVYVVPSGGGDPEPSGVFRFSIAAEPT